MMKKLTNLQKAGIFLGLSIILIFVTPLIPDEWVSGAIGAYYLIYSHKK